MNHSIEIPAPDDLAQMRGAGILLALTCQHDDLPRLVWSVDEFGHVVGTRTAGPDADVAADLGRWAGALDAVVTATPHRCDGRTIYRAHADLSGSSRVAAATPVLVTITGVGVLARLDTAPLASTASIEPDREYRRLSGEGLTEDQRRGNACVRCGLMDPPVSVTVGYVRGDGQVFACDPACPAPVEQPDPVEDEPQPHASWHQAGDGRYERAVFGVLWAVEMLDDTEISATDPGPGAYLYAPRSWPGDGVSRVGLDLTAGLLAADAAIAEWSITQAAAVAEWAGDQVADEPTTHYRDRHGRAWTPVDGTPPSLRLVATDGLCIWTRAQVEDRCGPLITSTVPILPGPLPVWTRQEGGRYQRDADGATWTLTRRDGGWFLADGTVAEEVRCGGYIDDARILADTHILDDAAAYEAWVEEGRATTEEHDPDLGRDIDGAFGEDS